MYPIQSDKIKITSNYGVKRKYKVNGKIYTDVHAGIDLVPSPSNNDAKIVSIADGKVVSVRKTGENGGNGCYVRIKHSNGLQTLYYHMKNKSIKVNVGDNVKKGDVLGVIGMTGLATGVHLHFQIDKGSSNTSINPYEYVFNGKDLVAINTSKKLLILPSTALSWRVYPLNKQPVKGNEKGYLRPHKFGGLKYSIVSMRSKNVAIIDTRDFGRVQIYVAPSTGAIIK